jgi:hypothetical protein
VTEFSAHRGKDLLRVDLIKYGQTVYTNAEKVTLH